MIHAAAAAPDSRRTGSWPQAVAQRRRTVLAGGLGADNVADAALAVRPWAVDASSRLETAPGIKDPQRLRAFLAATHGVPAAAGRAEMAGK